MGHPLGPVSLVSPVTRLSGLGRAGVATDQR